ncbi:hypothetical protein D3C81_1537930 [compost metagenome]
MGKGSLNRAYVKAPMLGELLIFAGYDRDLELVGDFIPGSPATLQVDGLVEPGLDLALDHQGGARRGDPAENQHQYNAARCKPEQGFREQA